MKPYNPPKFVPDMCKIAYNLTLKKSEIKSEKDETTQISIEKEVFYIY